MESSRIVVTIVSIVNALATDEVKPLDGNFCYMRFITIQKPEIFRPFITVLQKQGVIFLNSNSSRLHGTKKRKQPRKTSCFGRWECVT